MTLKWLSRVIASRIRSSRITAKLVQSVNENAWFRYFRNTASARSNRSPPISKPKKVY